MKNKQIFEAIGLTLAALFYAFLELIYQALRFLVKWFLVTVILTIEGSVFVVLLPFSLSKCAARAISHRSFSAGGQLMKWIWFDFWKQAGL